MSLFEKRATTPDATPQTTPDATVSQAQHEIAQAASSSQGHTSDAPPSETALPNEKSLPVAEWSVATDRRSGERRSVEQRRGGVRGQWEERRMFDRRRREYSIFGNKLDNEELPSREVSNAPQIIVSDDAPDTIEASLTESSKSTSSETAENAGERELVWEELDESEVTSEEKIRKASKRIRRDT